MNQDHDRASHSLLGGRSVLLVATATGPSAPLTLSCPTLAEFFDAEAQRYESLGSPEADIIAVVLADMAELARRLNARTAREFTAKLKARHGSKTAGSEVDA